jgi:hypothetical protein
MTSKIVFGLSRPFLDAILIARHVIERCSQLQAFFQAFQLGGISARLGLNWGFGGLWFGGVTSLLGGLNPPPPRWGFGIIPAQLGCWPFFGHC